MTVLYLDREAWGARTDLPRLGHRIPTSQLRGVVVHHTVFAMRDYDGDGIIDGDLDDVRRFMQALQTIRPDLGLDVPYSFVVFAGATPHDSIVCEGRGDERTGAHTAGFNSSRLGVAIAGNTSETPVTSGIIEGIRWCGSLLEGQEELVDTLPHQAFKSTECPGSSMVNEMHRVQPPFVATAAVLLDGESMKLINDTNRRRLFAVWTKGGTTMVREYGTYIDDAGEANPNISFVIDEQVRAGNMLRAS